MINTTYEIAHHRRRCVQAPLRDEITNATHTIALTTPMPSPERFNRFLDRYTDSATSATRPNENNRNSSHAVFGHE